MRASAAADVKLVSHILTITHVVACQVRGHNTHLQVHDVQGLGANCHTDLKPSHKAVVGSAEEGTHGILSHSCPLLVLVKVFRRVGCAKTVNETVPLPCMVEG